MTACHAALITTAAGADFTPGGDVSLNCRMAMSGEIVPGDAARFRQGLWDMQDSLGIDAEGADWYSDWGKGQIRICLDSPGGDLAEAVAMADTLVYLTGGLPENFGTFGTAIPGGVRCEGACAYLFMAGGYVSHLNLDDGGREPDRVLHTNGRLAFAPPVYPGFDTRHT